MPTTDPDYLNITVTLTNDDYWRLRHALVVATQHHEKARDKCKGNNQRSTDVILEHEHVMRRLEDVEGVLKAAYDQALKEATPAHEINEDGCSCGWENPVPWGTGEWQEPCDEGHFDCAQREGGPCAQKLWHDAYVKHEAAS
jgi:hypothetical protein